MTTPSEDGIVFRTDANLRPEGREGPLTRTLASYTAYYDDWARTWEFQALVKARPVAGDLDLGERFMAVATPRVWPEKLDPEAIREIRAMKERAEEITERKGISERELKRGPRRHPRHRVRGAAPPARARARRRLGALAHHARRAARARRRRLHRTRPTPTASTGRTGSSAPSSTGSSSTTSSRPTSSRPTSSRGSGSPGCSATATAPSAPRWSASKPSTATTSGPCARIHERLFFAPLLETLAGTGPLSPEAAEERLAAFGFTDVERTRAAVRELAAGLTRRSRVMRELLPVILGWLSETPDPDLGLLQLRRLAEGPARSASLAVTFRDQPGAAERTCHLLGTSRVVGDAMRRHPEFVDVLGDDDALAPEATRAELVADALDTLEWRGDQEQRREGLRRFKRRELLRIATRDLLGYARARGDRARAHRAGRGVSRSRAPLAATRRCRSR